MALYTFASNAPAEGSDDANYPLTPVTTAAQATPLIDHINAFTATGGTNWDRGIWQIAASADRYDDALVLTDGDPTYFGTGPSGPGSNTRFTEIENGIFSANALKLKATRVIAVGIGTFTRALGSIKNLKALSGPTLNSDFFTTSFGDLGPLLQSLALHNCAGITISKSAAPAISIVTTASAHSFNAAGLLITYFYRVTNTGNVTLIATARDKNAAPVVCPRSVLPPGRSMTCRSYHFVTAADVAAGHIPDVAIATGKAPDGTQVHADNPLNIPEVHAPAISIFKLASAFTFATAGTPVTYYYLVVNSGNATLDPVTVTDSRGLPVSCPRTALAPNEEMTCTAHYVTTQADVDRGTIANTGTVTGRAPDGAEVTDDASLDIPAMPAPALSIVKTASPVTFSAAGQLITYSYLVTNNGNVSLHGVTVTDSRGLALSCPSTSLAAGQAMTCTARYRTTQADVSAGPIINIALVQGSMPDGTVLGDASVAFVFPTVFFFPVTG